LFVFNEKYQDILEYNNSICAYYVNDKQSGYDCCKQILQKKVAPSNIINQTESNIKFYKEYINADPEVKDADLVASQCNVSREKAQETLLKNNNDIVQSIIELMNDA
jgi:NACalpha-BTF3-like transcription factor